MTTTLVEHRKIKITPDSEKIIRRCKRCGDAIPKDYNRSWKEYKKKVYCRGCLKRGIRNKPLANNIGELPIGDFIGTNTQNGRLMANYYIGILKAVDDNKNGSKPVYRGVEIANDMVKSAADWLTVNWIGRAGQRKPPDERVKRTDAELAERLKFLVPKVVRDEVIAGKILVLLEEAGL